MSRNVRLAGLAATLIVGALGCSLIKRDAKTYSEDTTALIQTKSGELKACYDGVLKGDEKTAGSVTVFFVVEKETGKVKDVEVQDSSVPETIKSCVEGALTGLTLDPGDADDGHATITFAFEPGPPPPAPPAPEAPPAAPNAPPAAPKAPPAAPKATPATGPAASALKPTAVHVAPSAAPPSPSAAPSAAVEAPKAP